jgi:hypothetical protein
MKPIGFPAILAFMFSWVLFPAVHVRAQATPPQFFWVCYAGANTPTVYLSGVMAGPVTAGQSFRVGFAQALMQRYSFQGEVVCVPAQNASVAQNSMNSRLVAWHNAKKTVVPTGWTESAQAASGTGSGSAPANQAANLLGLLNKAPSTAPAAPAANAPPNGQAAPQGAPQGGSPAASDADTAANVLAALFGSSPAPSGAGTGGAAGTKAQQAQTAGKAAASSTAAGANPNANAAVQVASTLSGIFKKGPSGSAAGNGAKPETAAANGAGSKGPGGTPGQALVANGPSGNLPSGALGEAQFANTMLVVYGCGRQGTAGTQVLCVTDLTNQNAKDTLVQSAAVWKDAFIVDDRGDRHTRTNGYFLNIDGEQRPQLDIDYGKSAHFILAFDDVQSKVEKIALRSGTGGLNVEGIPLIAVGATEASSTAQAQPSGAH